MNAIIAMIVLAARVGGMVFGIVIPTLIFVISFAVTWLLYKHFSTKH